MINQFSKNRAKNVHSPFANKEIKEIKGTIIQGHGVKWTRTRCTSRPWVPGNGVFPPLAQAREISLPFPLHSDQYLGWLYSQENPNELVGQPRRCPLRQRVSSEIPGWPMILSGFLNKILQRQIPLYITDQENKADWKKEIHPKYKNLKTHNLQLCIFQPLMSRKCPSCSFWCRLTTVDAAAGLHLRC